MFIWTNGLRNSGVGGDLRRHDAHMTSRSGHIEMDLTKIEMCHTANFLSLGAQEVFVMTAYGVTSEDNVGVTSIIGFSGCCYVSILILIS